VATDPDERMRSNYEVTGSTTGSLPDTYSDPAPDPVAIAEERTTQFVGNMTSQALNELRQQRDETDALMEAMKKNDKLLQAAINEHAERVASVIASKVIIAEQLGHLRELFAPVTPVLTQLNGGPKA
jgi:hypothetical protein